MNRALLIRFVVSAVVGAVLAVGTAAVFARPQIQSTAHGGDPMTLTGVDGAPLDFSLTAGAPKPLEPLPPTETLQLVSFHEGGPSTAPDGGPAAPWWNASTPRIRPITQFDGGPFAAVNCVLASGAMLARLGYGVVTTGSQLRTLQADQDGGVNYASLQDAVHQGWGIHFFSGELTPLQLRALLFGGAGAVITGIYGELPVDIRVQKSGFEGGHAVYVDTFRPPGPDGPAAYWVIDPIGHPWEGYKGAWWPAEIVERFAAQAPGGRIYTLWAFPGGTVPNDHPILPPSAYPGAGPGESPGASHSPGASQSPGATFIVDPFPPTDGAGTVGLPVGDPDVQVWNPEPFDFRKDVFDIRDPGVDKCATKPQPLGCPRGIVGIIDLDGLIKPPGTAPPTKGIDLLYATAVAPDTYQILFEAPPDTSADLFFWGADGSKLLASDIETAILDGKTISIATIVLNGSDTTYSFAASATGDGTRETSTVGTLKVGS